MENKKRKFYQTEVFLFPVAALCILAALYFLIPRFFSFEYDSSVSDASTTELAAVDGTSSTSVPVPVLDKTLYDKLLLKLANNPAPKIATSTASSTKRASTTAATLASTTKYLWPAKTVYPNAGALLPFNRIVAYYGNFYSKAMGVLGEYPPDEMIKKLMAEVVKWQEADPSVPVLPAIDYIAVSAQGSAGADGMYRARMPADQIQKALDLAKQVDGIVILDIQVGKSNVQTEIPLLAPYLKLPNVHLALDPEFSMKNGQKPGTVIGTMDATDVNFTANFLANLVKENNLPPKVLIVHRFTEHMVTNAEKITPLPEVQIVMDMDGWGAQSNKKKAYYDTIYEEPVEFTGLKLFYKNDLRPPSTGMLTTSQVLNLRPIPSFIQYQ